MAEATPSPSPSKGGEAVALRTPPRASPARGEDGDGPPKTPQTPQTPTGRTQALKDLKLTIEYKHLKQNAPGGVLVTPAFDDLRTWHGVIFVRKGCYQGGVFKFVVKLPRAYNDTNVWPEVRFTSRVTNPFVAPWPEGSSAEQPGGASPHGSGSGSSSGSSTSTTSGLLDLKAAYPAWDSQAHFMVTALTFVKTIFYLKDEDLAEYRARPANAASAHAFVHDKPQYLASAANDAALSQAEVYDNRLGSPIAFQPPNPKHAAVRELVVDSDDHAVRSSSFILEILKQAAAQVEAEAAAKEGEAEKRGAAEGSGS
jgi:hypothetical protein